ncbi:hypothetical protein ABZ313_24405 [Streptomyces sp. NPDC006251]|uniref:hypothetical protein n=1 Tax=Streptomyces sp. NPDC006251 TaxID=3155718 RepID=UPI00339F6397
MPAPLAGAAGRHLAAAAEHPQGLLPARIRADVLDQLLADGFARPVPESPVPAGRGSTTGQCRVAGGPRTDAGSTSSSSEALPGDRQFAITSAGFLALLSDSQRRAVTSAEPDGQLPGKVPWQTSAKLAKFRLVHFLDDEGNSYADDGDTGVGRPPRRPYLTELGRAVAASAAADG